MQQTYTPPAHSKTLFNCPYCLVFSRHDWSQISLTEGVKLSISLEVAVCEQCGESSVWCDKKLIWPVPPSASKDNTTKPDGTTSSRFSPTVPGEYTPPDYRKTSFHCPRCQVFSQQLWSGAYLTQPGYVHTSLSVAICRNCGEPTVWYDSKLIYPGVPVASKDASKPAVI